MTVNNMKHWLITGGTGFIGKALTHTLLAKGNHVTVLTRNIKSAAKHMPQQVTLIRDLSEITNAASINYIVNLAGEPLFGGLWTQKRKQTFFDSRLGTTTALLALVDRLETKPAVVVSGSAIGFYGMSQIKEFDETNTGGEDEMARLCRAWENAAQPMASRHTRLAILRTGLVLDSSGGMLEPLILSTKFGMGAKLGKGQQWMSWISLADIVRMILFIVEDDHISGPVNGTAPVPVQQADFIDTLAQHLNRPRFMTIPAAPLRFVLGDMANLLLNGQKVIPKAALDAGFTFEHTELKQAFA